MASLNNSMNKGRADEKVQKDQSFSKGEGETLIDGEKAIVTNLEQLKFRENRKVIMLVLLCCLVMGHCYCYDNPAPIETTLEADLGIS
jgi:hypothetical protein